MVVRQGSKTRESAASCIPTRHDIMSHAGFIVQYSIIARRPSMALVDTICAIQLVKLQIKIIVVVQNLSSSLIL